MKHGNLKLGRKFKRFVVAAFLVAVMAVTSFPTSIAMAAELPVEVSASYAQVDDGVMPLGNTYYFIPDQELSFKGTYVKNSFNVPSACQARLVIAPIGDEPLYIDVLNGKLESEHTIIATPNQAQVHVFNISAGTHYLQFSSISGSIFTIRLQMYTWDY